MPTGQEYVDLFRRNRRLNQQGLPNLYQQKELKFTPEEEAQYTDRLLRTLGTIESQSQNRFSDTAAKLGLPAASQIAGQRGISTKTAGEAREGQFQIEQYGKGINRSAAEFLSRLQFMATQNELDRQAAERAQNLDLFSNAAQVAGYGLNFIPGGSVIPGAAKAFFQSPYGAGRTQL